MARLGRQQLPDFLIMSDLKDARRLLAHGGIASAPEYLKALLEVAVALYDRTEPVAPAVADKKPTKGKAASDG